MLKIRLAVARLACFFGFHDWYYVEQAGCRKNPRSPLPPSGGFRECRRRDCYVQHTWSGYLGEWGPPV